MQNMIKEFGENGKEIIKNVIIRNNNNNNLV